MSSNPRVNINRLLRLADLLRGLPSEDFNMEEIVEDNSYSGQKAPECGTSCCIAGWATCVHPDLYLSNGGLYNKKLDAFWSTYEEAFASAFGLDRRIASDLTSPSAFHKTSKQAARAVEKVARDLAKEYGYEIVEV